MTNPPLSDIDLKNKLAWVWTSLKIGRHFLTWMNFSKVWKITHIQRASQYWRNTEWLYKYGWQVFAFQWSRAISWNGNESRSQRFENSRKEGEQKTEIVPNIHAYHMQRMIYVILYSNLSYGTHLYQKQRFKDPTEIDFGYIEYLRKSMMNETCLTRMEIQFKTVKFHEGLRDYCSPSLKQINHLIQLDQKPNLELKEPKWELYKISISFLREKNWSTMFSGKFHVDPEFLTP